jgi:hypothetical protein
VKESETLPMICIPFRSAYSSPTHVFVETEQGESKQFFRKNVLHVFRLILPSPADSPNFISPSHLQPLRSYLEQISAVAETAPCARTFFQPIQDSLLDVIRRYERGERRFNGRWMSLAEYESKVKISSESNTGNVELRLKNGKTLIWPRVQIQGQRLVYVSDIGVQAVHRDELVDEIKYLYFPDTRPVEEKKTTTDTETPQQPVKTTESVTITNSGDTEQKTTQAATRFFRLRDGTTHIGRVIVSDEEHLVIFTATAKTYRIRKEDIVIGLDEQLANLTQ